MGGGSRVLAALLTVQVVAVAGFFLPWGALDDSGFIIEIGKYLQDSGSDSTLDWWEGLSVLAPAPFIISFVAGLCSIALVSLRRIPRTKRISAPQIASMLSCLFVAGPLTYLQMNEPPLVHGDVWADLQYRIGIGWYIAMTGGALALILAVYIGSFGAVASKEPMTSEQERSRFLVSPVRLQSLLNVLVAIGAIITVYGFYRTWVSFEITYWMDGSFNEYVSGFDQTGPLVIIPIAAIASAILSWTDLVSRARGYMGILLLAKVMVVLSLTLTFYWWMTLPEHGLLSRSYWFDNTQTELGWYISVASQLLMLSCLFLLDWTQSRIGAGNTR